MVKKLVLAGLLLWGAWNWAASRPVSLGPGVLAPESPLQQTVAGAEPFLHGDYELTPLAAFEVKARVLGREDYSLDAGASLSPMDLALGWGRMSDERILEHIDIRQSGRFYFWSTDQFPIPRREIESHSANMHLVPSRPGVESIMDDVREGQLIALRGFLIRARHRNGATWSSSLTREDTGNGACETIYVEQFRILEPATSYWRISMWSSLAILILSLAFHFTRPYKPY